MLEVCVESIASAIAAHKGGASRIELCSSLADGGLTPTTFALKTLKSMQLPIPIFCMLRPKGGNDYIYSETDMQRVLHDLLVFKSLKCDGFVFGALDENKCIAEGQCRLILKAAGDLPVTFHRAFDRTDPKKMHDNIKMLRSIGFKRILTSGFKDTCLEGLDNLRQICNVHHDITIMPGGGITPDNLPEILAVTKCKEFHASARKIVGDGVEEPPAETTTSCDADGPSQTFRYITDENVVRKLVEIAHQSRNTTE